MKHAALCIYALIAFSGPALAQVPLPSCTPPIASTIAIAYQGASSGCSQAQESPPCIVGETVQFTLASGANVGNCRMLYTWNFPEGSVTGQPPESHQFQEPGTFTVALTMSRDLPVTLTFSQPVRVAAASSIDTLHPGALLLLLVALAAMAAYHLP